MARNGGFRGEEDERAHRLHLLPASAFLISTLHPQCKPANIHHVTWLPSHSSTLGARLSICINVRGGQDQCEILHVMLLMTCSFTQGLSPNISLVLS